MSADGLVLESDQWLNYENIRLESTVHSTVGDDWVQVQALEWQSVSGVKTEICDKGDRIERATASVPIQNQDDHPTQEINFRRSDGATQYGEIDRPRSCESISNPTGLSAFLSEVRLAQEQSQLARKCHSETLQIVQALVSETLSKILELAGQESNERFFADALRAGMQENTRKLESQCSAIVASDQRIVDLEKLSQGFECRGGRKALFSEIETEAPGEEEGFVDESALEVPDEDLTTPTVVEDYHNCAGEVFVIDERLGDAQVDLEERLTLEQQDGGFLDGSSQALQLRLLRLNESLVEALRRLLDRKDDCFKQGIDPEQFRYRRMS